MVYLLMMMANVELTFGQEQHELKLVMLVSLVVCLFLTFVVPPLKSCTNPAPAVECFKKATGCCCYYDQRMAREGGEAQIITITIRPNLRQSKVDGGSGKRARIIMTEMEKVRHVKIQRKATF